jgi:hypothetical protein
MEEEEEAMKASGSTTREMVHRLHQEVPGKMTSTGS